MMIFFLIWTCLKVIHFRKFSTERKIFRSVENFLKCIWTFIDKIELNILSLDWNFFRGVRFKGYPVGIHLLKVSSSNIRTMLASVVLMLLLLTLSRHMPVCIYFFREREKRNHCIGHPWRDRRGWPMEWLLFLVARSFFDWTHGSCHSFALICFILALKVSKWNVFFKTNWNDIGTWIWSADPAKCTVSM